MKLVLAAFAGALFALGLALGGMTDPAKVIAFLDVGRAWDPQLAFVMAGAVGMYALGRRLRTTPVLADRFHHPAPAPIDARLVGGAAIFGVGWGLSGYCPGPAVASLATPGAAVFVGAMVVGIALARAVSRGSSG